MNYQLFQPILCVRILRRAGVELNTLWRPYCYSVGGDIIVMQYEWYAFRIIIQSFISVTIHKIKNRKHFPGFQFKIFRVYYFKVRSLYLAPTHRSRILAQVIILSEHHCLKKKTEQNA